MIAKDNIKIFQSYINEDDIKEFDPAFIPNDWRHNPAPEYREMKIFFDFFEKGRYKEAEYVGVLSKKFNSKTKITGKKFIEFIENNPGYDVYFINPFPSNIYISYNVWEHGELCHPGIKATTQALFDYMGFPVSLETFRRNDHHSTLYCNYWVGNKTFWESFIPFLKRLIHCIENEMPQNTRAAFFGQTYYENSTFYLLPFIFERVFSTFILAQKGLKFLAYPHSPQEILDSCVGEQEVCVYSQFHALIDAWDNDKSVSSDTMRKMLDKIFYFHFSRWDHVKDSIIYKSPYVILKKKNICVFSHYDKDNIIDEYVVHYLKKLAESDCNIVFVTTVKSMAESEKNKIFPYCDVIIVRSNEGRDFGSYKCGISAIANLDNYEKLILANDSVYGPVYDLDELLAFGDKKNLDMWGVTDSYEIDYHIQSYFVVYSNKILRSPEFKTFWTAVHNLTSRQEIIFQYEINGSQYFIKNGFKLGALCHYQTVKEILLSEIEVNRFNEEKNFKYSASQFKDLLLSRNLNFTLYLWDKLIAYFRCPFIKRELLSANPTDVNISYWPELIKQYTNYDCALITNHLQRHKHTANVDWLYIVVLQSFVNIDIPRFLYMASQLLADNYPSINLMSESGVINLLAWWEQAAHDEFPIMIWPKQAEMYPSVVWDESADVVQDSVFKITKGLMATWVIRRDLQTAFSLNTTESRKQFIYWWLCYGIHESRLLLPSEKQKEELLATDTLIAQDASLPIPKLLSFVYQFHHELREAYSLDTTQGRQGLIDWWLNCEHEKRFSVPQILKDYLGNGESKKTEFQSSPIKQSYLTDGINITGFAKGIIGIGEDVRMASLSMSSSQLKHSIYNVPMKLSITTETHEVNNLVNDSLVYANNLICLPASETFRLYLKVGRSYFDKRFNIGAWQWELPRWPEVHKQLFKMLQEVWAFSHYAENMFLDATSIPVTYMPLAVEVPVIASFNRDEFGLPKDKFLFLVMFDSNSWVKRKNPLAAVKAFTKAFPASEQQVGLVIKTMNEKCDEPEWQVIKEYAAKDPRIIIKIEVYSRLQTVALIGCCDAYLSLHRAEGFGRILAESMLLGKPVIATNFSGNTDFTKPDTAFMVNGPMVNLKPGDYSVWEGQYWCEPDIDEAARQMQVCFENATLRESIAAAGKSYVQTYHSAKAVGERYKRRLKEIGVIE